MILEFHFDFGSPNSYLAHKVLPGIAARTGATIAHVPALLGGVFKATGNKPPMQAFAGIKNKPDYEMLQMRRFIAKHGLTRFQMNPHFPVNTLTIMRGAVAARRDGVQEAYIDAVFAAMWEEGKKMDDPAIITAVLDAAGLDGAALLAATQDQAVKDELAGLTEASVARGTFGSPTFFVGDEIWFGKDSLRDVEEALAGL